MDAKSLLDALEEAASNVIVYCINRKTEFIPFEANTVIINHYAKPFMQFTDLYLDYSEKDFIYSEN